MKVSPFTEPYAKDSNTNKMDKKTILRRISWTAFFLSAGLMAAWGAPASYLDMDPVARPSGMGSAFTALSDDLSAPLFNPAGLANMGLNQTMLGGSFGFLNGNQYQNYYAAAQQLPDGAIGFHAIQYGINGLSHGINAPEPNFQDTEWALGATYAYELDYHFQAGISSSFLYQDLTGLEARGFGGIDLGLMVVPSVLYDVSFGLCARHLGGFLAWDSGLTEHMDPNVRLGGSWKLFHKKLALDYDAEWQGQPNFSIINHIGIEWWSFDSLALRGGWDQDTPALGLTLLWNNYSLDYSVRFQDYAGLGSLHRFALNYAL